MTLRDDGHRYGLVSRVLHWGMAGLLLWQLGGVAAAALLGEVPLTEAWGSSHKSVGALLFVLASARAVWGLMNFSRRPSAKRGVLGGAAKFGHLGLYLLMLIVPALALLRQFGSGRRFEVFGLVLMQGGAPRNEALIAPGAALHGLLGWVLLAAIVGHILMTLVHQFVWKDDTLRRMAA